MTLEIEKRTVEKEHQSALAKFKSDKDAELDKAKRDYVGESSTYFNSPHLILVTNNFP